MSSQAFSQLITVSLQYNGIKIRKQSSDFKCVKNFRGYFRGYYLIQGWFSPYYTTFWLNTGTYPVSLHIQCKCWKKFAKKSSKQGNFSVYKQLLRNSISKTYKKENPKNTKTINEQGEKKIEPIRKTSLKKSKSTAKKFVLWHFKLLHGSRMICLSLNISEKLHWQHLFEKLNTTSAHSEK